MPYAETTAEHCQPELAEPAALKSLLEALCSVLADAHEAGWVHRDIKPANILRFDGRWVLADWGIVRLSAARPPMPSARASEPASAPTLLSPSSFPEHALLRRRLGLDDEYCHAGVGPGLVLLTCGPTGSLSPRQGLRFTVCAAGPPLALCNDEDLWHWRDMPPETSAWRQVHDVHGGRTASAVNTDTSDTLTAVGRRL
jgi:serine/threonine protein kinase